MMAHLLEFWFSFISNSELGEDWIVPWLHTVKMVLYHYNYHFFYSAFINIYILWYAVWDLLISVLWCKKCFINNHLFYKYSYIQGSEKVSRVLLQGQQEQKWVIIFFLEIKHLVHQCNYVWNYNEMQCTFKFLILNQPKKLFANGPVKCKFLHACIKEIQ